MLHPYTLISASLLFSLAIVVLVMPESQLYAWLLGGLAVVLGVVFTGVRRMDHEIRRIRALEDGGDS